MNLQSDMIWQKGDFSSGDFNPNSCWDKLRMRCLACWIVHLMARTKGVSFGYGNLRILNYEGFQSELMMRWLQVSCEGLNMS